MKLCGACHGKYHPRCRRRRAQVAACCGQCVFSCVLHCEGSLRWLPSLFTSTPVCEVQSAEDTCTLHASLRAAWKNEQSAAWRFPQAREPPLSLDSPSLLQVLLERLPHPPSAPPALGAWLRGHSASEIPAPSTAEPASAAGIPTCPVCMLNWPNAALDCGHRVCAACLPEIQRRANCCPVCRDPIRQVMRLYN
mmetsp:Transcript_46719/g.109118  ORF Transcript_46719/g.109118 Transcript_46719/m.109118 type:complete len:194 (-) Transcript_46719:158-739(-)